MQKTGSATDAAQTHEKEVLRDFFEVVLFLRILSSSFMLKRQQEVQQQQKDILSRKDIDKDSRKQYMHSVQ
jgi:hypothetical protein